MTTQIAATAMTKRIAQVAKTKPMNRAIPRMWCPNPKIRAAAAGPEPGALLKEKQQRINLCCKRGEFTPAIRQARQMPASGAQSDLFATLASGVVGLTCDRARLVPG